MLENTGQSFRLQAYSHKHLLFCGIAACALAPMHSAYANPSGGSVVSGQASISHNGGTTTINQLSQRAIIEWQDFSISQGELTQFLQSGSDAAVLNKVISNLPSHILGSLKANGNVFLINPNGVVIGNGAQINANSFIASTLNISNADFMKGGDLTFKGDSQAAIVNLGEVRAGQGDVYLLARQIKNEGLISASNGEVGLAAGSEIYLSADDGRGRRVTVKANDFALALKDKVGVDNAGVIEAARAILATHNGDIYDMAINNSGTVIASGMTTNADGSISLFATSSGTRSAGRVRNSGTLKARNYDGGGGTVSITGEHITLANGSMIDVSAAQNHVVAPLPAVKPDLAQASADNRGSNGGGTVLIGGEYQGQGSLQTAQTTQIDAGSVIKANAGQDGDGGKIIVWADDRTEAGGTYEAVGGTQSGSGGFVETSGKNTLKIDSAAIVNIAAGNDTGRGGQWLLDPTNITVSDAGGDVDTATINATLNGGGDVTIQTADAGADNGDITITNATIDKSSSNNAATLTFRAHRRITTGNSTITSSSGDALSVIFNANSDSIDGGNVRLFDTVIDTSGGDLTIGGGADPLLNAALGYASGSTIQRGVLLDNTQITTAAGRISIRGEGYTQDTSVDSAHGIALINASSIDTTTGSILLEGTGGINDDANYGVVLDGAGVRIRSVDGDISITGVGGADASYGRVNNHGVFIDNGASIVSTGTGADAATITISGTGGTGDDSNHGVFIDGTAGSLITSVDGAIALTGVAGSALLNANNDNVGILLNNSASITSTGVGANAATITLNGIGGGGTALQHGIHLVDADIAAVDGDISLTGFGFSRETGNDFANYGVAIQSGSTIVSTGTSADAANITIDGRGGGGEDSNRGVTINNSGTLLTSAYGDISITGQGGSNGSDGSDGNYGVYLTDGAGITSTGTGADAAKITIDATGGAGDNNNWGLRAEGSGSVITSIDGDVSITGRGGANVASSSTSNHGVSLGNSLLLASTGTGADAANITINATGGAGEDSNRGFEGFGNLNISTIDGDISITGQGGSAGVVGSNNNAGVYFTGAVTVNSTGVGAGAGTITIDGTGGAGGDNNHGVLMVNSTSLNSVDGDISVTGRGSSNGSDLSDRNRGIYAHSSSAIRSTGSGANAASIMLNGTGGAGENDNYGVFIENAGSIVTSVDGDISIVARAGSNGSTDSNNNRGFYLNDGAVVTSTGVGSDAATITIDGTGGAGDASNIGVLIERAGTVVGSIDGDISIVAQGGSNGGGSNNRGFSLGNNAVVTSTGVGADAAKITIDGTGGAGSDNNYGVLLASASSITSFDGDILIDAQGGSSGVSISDGAHGFYMESQSVLSSTGTTADAAKITITGIAGAGQNSNNGVRIEDADTTLSSAYGDISITGYGGSNGTGDNNYGVLLNSGADIISTGTGADAAKITIDGTGGAGDDNNWGVYLLSSGTTMTSVDGDISITGHGGGNGLADSINNTGVFITTDALISTDVGMIDIVGYAGGNAGSTSMRGIRLDEAEISSTGDNAGDIKIHGIGSDGANFVYGASINGDITSKTGDIYITGDGLGNSFSGAFANLGLSIGSTADIVSTGTGADAANIHLTGTNIGTNDLFRGIEISAGGDVQTVDGDIFVTTDTGSSNSGFGFGAFFSSAALSSDLGASGDGNIVINTNGTGSAERFATINSLGSALIGSATMTGDITVIADSVRIDTNTTFQTLGDIIFAPQTNSGTIGLGSGTGVLSLTTAELSNLSAGGRIIIGDAAAGTGAVNIDGISAFTNYDVYGGSIIAKNLSGVDGSSSTYTARTGDLTLFENDISSTIGADIIDDVKTNFKTLAGDLILAPETASDSIGIAGEVGAFTLTQADLSGFSQIGRNIVVGDPVSGAGTVRIGALDLSSQAYGFGAYGSNLTLSGAVQSSADLSLGADSIFFNNYDLIADDDVIITTQNTALDIGVSGGAGAISISDLVLDDIFAGNDGSGDLIIGDATDGSGDINIDGLDLSAQNYGLKFYGGRVNLNNASISSGADLVLGGDTLLNFTATQNAKGSIEIAPRSAVLVNIEESANSFTYNGDTFSLGLLNANSDAVGTEGLVLGSAAGGDVTWISGTHDFNAINARTGGVLTLQNTNLATSYGLGDGTSGDITYSTAQLEGLTVGQQLVIGDAAAGTGNIDVADLSAADLGFGLNASGANIDIGGWNGGTNDVTLTARTGNITTQSGLITAGDLTLNAAGDIGTNAQHLNTAIDSLAFISGGDVYVDEANALNINASSTSGAGTVEIVTAAGAVDIAGDLNVAGDTLIEAGGTDHDLIVTGEITSTANVSSTLDLRASGTIDFVTSGDSITNSNGAALNVILNADRDANQAGAVKLVGTHITTNGGDLTIGGGADPLTGYAYGTQLSNLYGVTISGGSQINTGAGNITVHGHGSDERNIDTQIGVFIRDSSVFSTTSGDIALYGIGGNGKNNNYGVRLENAGTLLTSVDGDISLTGVAGSNGHIDSDFNRGVYLRDGAQIRSTGVGANAGTITLNGTGGDGEDSNNGIRIEDTDTLISSIDGAIALTGQGGSNGQTGSETNHGVLIFNGATIESTGVGADAATITVTGTAGDGEDSNIGVRLNTNGASIRSVDGDVLLTGRGGSNSQFDSNSNSGVELDSAASISSTGTRVNAAKITVNGTGAAGDNGNSGVNLNGSAVFVSSVDGDIAINGVAQSNGQLGSDSNRGIYLGGGAQLTSTGVGIDAATITLSGTGGKGHDLNHGILINNSTTRLTSIDGDITLTGVGGSNGLKGSSGNRGVYITNGANVLSSGTGDNAANITFDGTGGAGEDANYGVSIESSGAMVRTIDGDIMFTGVAGSYGRKDSNANYGVLIHSDAHVQSRGTGDNAGTITIDGTGGAGEDSNHGVRIAFTDAEVSSIDGDISITGRGGSYGQTSSDANHGVHLYVNGAVESLGTDAGAAKITINGTGAMGHSSNDGIRLEAQGAAPITSAYGDISLIGKGNTALNGDHNDGFHFGVGNITSTGVGADAAKITLNGTGGAGDDSNYGVNMVSNGSALSSIRSVDGDISITGQGGTSGLAGSSSNRGMQIALSTDITSTGTGEHAANITLNGTGAAADSNNYGVYLSNAQVSVVDGDIYATGAGGSTGKANSNNNNGVYVVGGSTLVSTGVGEGAGQITLDGTAGAGGYNNYGIQLQHSTTSLVSVDGDISLIGVAGSNGRMSGDSNVGIYFASDPSVTSTGTGAHAANITLNGTGGAGDDNNYGIYMIGSSSVNTIDGDISLTGRAGSNGDSGSVTNSGVVIQNNTAIASTGTGDDAGDIHINGIGSNGGAGVFLGQQDGIRPSVSVVDGAINVLAQAGSGGAGFQMFNGSFVESTGTVNARDITITAIGNDDNIPAFASSGGIGERRIHTANANIIINASHSSPDNSVDVMGVSGITSLQTLNQGDITINLDGGIRVQNPSTISADGTLTIAPLTDMAATIGIGGGSGDINITDDELSRFTAGQGFVFGDRDNGTGDVDIDSAVFAAGKNLEFYGGAINLDGGITNAQDITFGGTSLVTSAGALTATRDVSFLVDVVDVSGGAITAGRDVTFQADTLDVSGNTVTATRDVSFLADAVDVSGGAVTAGRDVTFQTDILDLNGNIVSAGRDVLVAPRLASSSIGLGDGAGTLSLDPATLALLNATERLVVGYQDTGTGVINIDNVDVSAGAYDFVVYGGSLNVYNGLSVDGEFLGQAYTGDIGVFDGAIQAVGLATLDAQQGQFNTNMSGATLFDVVGGNYTLYTGNFLESDVLPLGTSSTFIYGENSTTLPQVGLAAGINHVILRDNLGGIALDTSVVTINNDIQQFAQAPVALVDLSDAPPSVLSTQRRSAPIVPNTKSDDAVYIDGVVNEQGFDGVGINTESCSLSSEKEISCGAVN